jgi:DNA-binding transcriptional regulator YdaS (Cro superfamily)
MQEIFERKFLPFEERFDRLVELTGKTRRETAHLLGITPQGLNQAIKEGTTPPDRRLLCDLLIEKIETQFQSSGAQLERTVRDIVRDELRTLFRNAQTVAASTDATAIAIDVALGSERPQLEAAARLFLACVPPEGAARRPVEKDD